MRITDEVVVDAAPERVFALLVDPEAAVPCLPGAWAQDGWAGLTVRIGALTPAYRGTVRLLAVDREARRLVLDARGRDERDDPDVGPGGARLELAVAPDPEGTGAVLHLDADLVVRGRVARCGRGVLAEVCHDLTAAFARALGEHLASLSAPAPEPPGASERGADGPEVRSRGGLDPSAVAAVVAAGLGVGALVAAVVARRRRRTVR